MTTISNLNVVVQQGDSAREAQNVRSHAQDPAQAAALHREENLLRRQTTVQESAHSDRLRWDHDRRKKQQAKARQNRKRHPRRKGPEAHSPDSAGRLLNTIV